MGGPEDHPAVSPPEDPVPLGTGGALVHLRLSHPRPSRSGCREGRQLVSPPSQDGRAALWARVCPGPGMGGAAPPPPAPPLRHR